MEHDQLVIEREVYVQLHSVANARRRLKGGQRVFRDALIYLVQAAVCIIAAHEGCALLLVPLPGSDKEGTGPGQGQRAARCVHQCFQCSFHTSTSCVSILQRSGPSVK